MMSLKPRRVIANHNLPDRMPLVDTFALYLLLDHFNPPMAIWALVFLGLAAMWFLFILHRVFDEEVDLVNR